MESLGASTFEAICAILTLFSSFGMVEGFLAINLSVGIIYA